MNNVIKHKSTTVINMTVAPDYSVKITNSYLYCSTRQYPLIYFDKDNFGDSPYSIIFSSTYKPYIASLINNKTLFISPHSKVSRDLVRNSGYKITYSEDKADFIVIPKPFGKDYKCMVNLIVLNTATNELYICNINNRGYDERYDAEFFVNKIAEYLNITDKSILDYHANDNVYSLFPIWLFKGCEEYHGILNGTVQGTKYILDSDLPLTPTNKLSVETLDMWRRLAKSDDNLLEKSILNSDAREYPFTMFNFLWYDSTMRYKSKPQKIRWMMESMGIRDDWPSSKTIEPKDLNLIQDYILYLLGVDGKSGFISTMQYNDLPYAYQRLLMTRFAVCPVRIDSPTNYANIQAMAKNN